MKKRIVSLIIAALTFLSLLPVTALADGDIQFICGKVEHVHDENCYDLDGVFTCTIPEHRHTESCLAGEAGNDGPGVNPYNPYDPGDPVLFINVRLYCNDGTQTYIDLNADNGTITLPDKPFTREGYFLQGWSESPGVDDSGEIDYPRGMHFDGLRTNLTLYAIWCSDTSVVDITAAASPTEGGTVSGGGDYVLGETVTITATPNEGYVFVNWAEDGEFVSDDAACSFTAEVDRILTAVFKRGGRCGDQLNWSLEGDVLTISGTGAMWDYNNPHNNDGDLAPWRNMDFTALVVEDGVTGIGSFAFFERGNLPSVDLGGVTSIGNSAFSFCGGLASVDLGSVTNIRESAFKGCYSLAEVDLGGVTSIESCAFYGCVGLTSITLPVTVTKIELLAFGHLATVYYEGTSAQWANVTKANNWNGDCPAEVICLGDPQTPEYDVTARLVDADTGEGLADRTVYLYAGGDYYLQTSDEEGYVTFEDLPPTRENEVCVLGFDGTEDYEANSVEFSISEDGTVTCDGETDETGAVLLKLKKLTMTGLIFNPAYLHKGESGEADYAGWTFSPDFPTEMRNDYDEPMNLVTYGGNVNFTVEQTIPEVPAGIYRLSVYGYYRAGSAQDEAARVESGEPTHNLAMFAETGDCTHTQYIMNLYEGATDDDVTGNNNHGIVPGYEDLFVPDGEDDSREFFIAGHYRNDLEFIVREDGPVRIGVTHPEGRTYDGDYAPIGAWELELISPIVEPEFKTCTLLLTGQIGVNFYADLSGLTEEEREEVTVEFSVNGVTTTDTFDADCTDPDGNGYYGFTCFVNSIEMADGITATLYYREDREVSAEYSVKDYVDYVLDNADDFPDSVVSLVGAIADYGHYSQLYFEPVRDWTLGVDHAEMPAVNELGADDVAAARDATAGAATGFVPGDSSIVKAGFSLVLDSETTIRIYLTPEDGFDGDVGAVCDGKDLICTRQNSGRYMIEIPGIAAFDLGDTYIVTVTAAGEDAVINLSPLSYVRAVLNSESGDAAQYLATALYRYYLAAKAYYEDPNG